MAKYYTILQSDKNQTAAEKAETISREMYKISRPAKDEDDVTLYLFNWFINDNGTIAAIEIDDEQEMPVHADAKMDELLGYFEKVATKVEMETLKASIEDKKQTVAKVKDLLPDKMPKFSKKDLVNMGFDLGANHIQ